jgi:ribosome recycling factor
MSEPWWEKPEEIAVMPKVNWPGEAEFFRTTDVREKDAIDALTREFSTLRTGRATPALLDGIRVDAYGGHTPLNQLAGVTAPEARLIVIQPWDKSLLQAIEKAIQKSDLGLTPSNDGQLIRLPIPTLTEERRKDLVKVARRLAEDCRVEVRQRRRESNELLKAAEKEGAITEDELRKYTTKVQELTDRSVSKIDEILARKEKEILEG